MAVGFSLEVKKISRATALLSLIGRNLGLEKGKSIVSALLSMGARKAVEEVRKATQPQRVRFYNPSPVTDICTSLNGEIWPVGDPKIQVPPLHWNCKSVLIYE